MASVLLSHFTVSTYRCLLSVNESQPSGCLTCIFMKCAVYFEKRHANIFIIIIKAHASTATTTRPWRRSREMWYRRVFFFLGMPNSQNWLPNPRNAYLISWFGFRSGGRFAFCPWFHSNHQQCQFWWSVPCKRCLLLIINFDASG